MRGGGGGEGEGEEEEEGGDEESYDQQAKTIYI